MFVRETKNHDYALQFESHDEAKLVLDRLENHELDNVKRLGIKLRDRLTDQYAHDNIVSSAIVFSDEAPILIHAVVTLGQVQETPIQGPKQKGSLLGFFGKKNDG